MLFREIAATSERVTATRSRKQKIDHLAECIAKLTADEVAIGVGYLAGVTRQGKLGLGYAAVRKWVPESAATAASLSLKDVDEAFDRIANASGTGSSNKRRDEWLHLMKQATSPEQSLLTRLVIGEIRQGALEGVVIEGVAKAAKVSPSSVRRAVMLGGSLIGAARAALTKGEAGLGAFRIQLFRPVAPMLAQTAQSPEEAIAELGAAAFEYKLDGARIQVHKEGDQVRIFSRRMNEVTPALPQTVALVKALPAETLVLDGEAIALRSDGMPHAFQDTMRRFSRRSEDPALESKLPLHPYFFDVLSLGGEDLIDAPLEDRIRALEASVPTELLIPRSLTDDPAEVRAFYERALEAGHEGIMGKSLDAIYQAGGRGQSWLKVKLTHTFDLVVLAAEWGSGRRQGFLSNLHLGARDPAGGFVMLGKTFKGMTDEMLAWQTERLQQLATETGEWVVHVKPELVVEIAFNDVQRSSHYPGGVALRFARVKRHRPDKSPADANTIDEVRALVPDAEP